jgi:protein-S-isoprenylcysteine O-methyltransferase Ste14
MVMAWNVQAPGWLLALCVSLNAFGIFFVFTTDMQKYVALRLRPGTLVTDGMMSLSRNTNYFGEFLIYLAFALLPMSLWALLPLAVFIAFYWVPNMVRKDRSLASLPGFADYKKKTKSFFPFLF